VDGKKKPLGEAEADGKEAADPCQRDSRIGGRGGTSLTTNKKSARVREKQGLEIIVGKPLKSGGTIFGKGGRVRGAIRPDEKRSKLARQLNFGRRSKEGGLNPRKEVGGIFLEEAS